MKSYVGDLISVIRSSANGNGSRGNSGGLPRIQTVKSLTSAAKKVASKHLVTRGQESLKIARPGQVIPMEDSDFKDF